VQGLDVAEDVLELEAARFDAVLAQRPEHESVVGIGAVAEADQHGGRRLASDGLTPPEEPTLQWAEELAPTARLLPFLAAVALRRADVVLEAVVRGVERILELVALEDVVVAPRLVAGPVLRVDCTADRPEASLLALDPDLDPLVDPRVVPTLDRA